MSCPAFAVGSPLVRGVGRQSWSVTPRRRKHRLAQRQAPVARIRWGRDPDPEIPEALHLAPEMLDIDFAPFDFSTLEGKVVYAVNVASEDDYTRSNYEMMVRLHEEYQSQGFEILAFPSNWFGQRETRPNKEIKEWVAKEFGAKFIIMNKFDYEENPVFAMGQKYFPGEIIWNFHGKFLFGRAGTPVDRFDLLTTEEQIKSRVEQALALTKEQAVALAAATPVKDEDDADDEGDANDKGDADDEEDYDDPDMDAQAVERTAGRSR